MSTPEPLRFEDFTPGRTFAFGDYTITESEIIAFAKEYDPQPMHTDPEAAKHGMTGGLIASGWHMCALAMRLLKQHLLHDTTSLGSPGVDEVQWRKPVRPGDHLSMEAEVMHARTSFSMKDRGFVTFRFNLFRSDAGVTKQLAMTYVSPIMIRKREA